MPRQAPYFAMAGGRGPAYTSPMHERFSDLYENPTTFAGNDYSSPNSSPFKLNDAKNRPTRQFSTNLRHNNQPFDPFNDYVNTFYNNQWDLSGYYKNLAESPIYKGMFEAIGRATIYAAQFMNNPFAKFMKEPVTQGNAVMSGIFKEIYSREWKIRGDGGRYPGEGGDDPTRSVSTLPLFSAHVPELMTNVARLEFVREIPIKMNAQEYAKYCQTPDMIGQIGAALMSISNATYMNDMFTACKEYFCGPIRIRKDPITTVQKQPAVVQERTAQGSLVYPGSDQGYDEYAQVMAGTVKNRSPMVAVLDGTAEGDPVWCEPKKLLRLLHKTADQDFRFMSKKYNPAENNCLSEKVTCIMDRHLYYDTFCREYADTYHEGYIKPDMIDFQWIDTFPEMSSSIYNPDYKLIAMLVDDNAPAIYPQGDGLTVQTWFDPQEESMNFFTHYKYIMDYKPFFNRKYIFIKRDNIMLKDYYEEGPMPPLPPIMTSKAKATA